MINQLRQLAVGDALQTPPLFAALDDNEHLVWRVQDTDGSIMIIEGYCFDIPLFRFEADLRGDKPKWKAL